MAQIDDTIATYLTAIDVEGKTLWGAIIRSDQCSPRFSVS